MIRTPPRAFTIVELLVVITVIVILLALLAPALDNAIYQAELAVCSANQSSVAMSLNIYAANHKRWYPNRPGVGQYAMATWQITGAGVNVNWTPNLRGYISFNKQFNDPLCQKIDIEESIPRGIFMPYSYYAGGRFSQKNGAGTYQKGMNKLGDRLEWHLDETDTRYSGGPRRYDLLFSDYAYTAIARNQGQGSHPDKAAVWRPQLLQDGPNRHEPTASTGVTRNTITETMWWGGIRGAIDLNFAYADGAVQRVTDVAFVDDDRMDLIPAHWDNQYRWRTMVPSR